MDFLVNVLVVLFIKNVLLKTGLPLMKHVIKPLVNCVLIPLGLTAAASAADAGIHKKLGSEKIIISND